MRAFLSTLSLVQRGMSQKVFRVRRKRQGNRRSRRRGLIIGEMVIDMNEAQVRTMDFGHTGIEARNVEQDIDLSV